MKEPIVPFPKFGAGLGLHRVAAIAERMQLDLSAFAPRAAVITGSNGKGSVAAMLAAILAEAAPDVGCFTSPHLFSIRERFAIDGDAIDPEALDRHWARALDAAQAYERAHPGDGVGGFEFLFLTAASWFAEQRCGFTVWEAGIGGRYDPTRLVRAPHAALVSLDREHTALLGDTLELIALDKSEACAPGGRLLVGPTPDDLAPRIVAHNRLRAVRTDFLVEGRGWKLHDDDHIAVDLSGETLVVAPPLAGPHQRSNTALAVRLGYDMLRESKASDSAARAAVVAGLARTVWPGRLEEIETRPPIVIDVGHTPDAIAAARAGFERAHRPCVLVCGASRDKETGAIVRALAPGFRVIICAAARHKGAPASEIAAHAATANPEAEIVVAETMADARQTALHRAEALHGSVYVAGGLFLAAEFKAAHQGLDPARLHFF